MNVPNINLALRLDMFLGAVVFLVVILWLLKKGRLTVRYSIIWLMAATELTISCRASQMVAWTSRSISFSLCSCWMR